MAHSAQPGLTYEETKRGANRSARIKQRTKIQKDRARATKARAVEDRRKRQRVFGDDGLATVADEPDLTVEQINALQGLRKRTRARNAKYELVIQALLSKFDRFALRKTHDAAMADSSRLKMVQKLIVDPSGLTFRNSAKPTAVPPFVDDILRMLRAKVAVPAGPQGQYKQEQLDGDNVVYNAFRLPDEQFIGVSTLTLNPTVKPWNATPPPAVTPPLPKRQAERQRKYREPRTKPAKKRAGVELVGIEPNPGPAHKWIGSAATILLLWWVFRKRGSTTLDQLLHIMDNPLVYKSLPGRFICQKSRMEVLGPRAHQTMFDRALNLGDHVYVVLQCPLDPQLQILTFVLNDRRYLKFLTHTGYYYIDNNLFDMFSLRYKTSSVVSFRSFVDLLEASHRDRFGCSRPELDHVCIEQLASLMFSLLGGTKGSRMIQYFTTPVYSSTQGNTAPAVCHPADDSPPTACPEAIEAKDIETDDVYHTEIVPSLLSSPAVLPVMCTQSDLGAVQDRLYSINPVKIRVPPKYYEYARRFSVILSKDVAVCPFSDTDVIERQSSAVTRERMTNAIMSFCTHSSTPEVKAFIKKEAYAEPKDLRNISAINPEHNYFGFTFGLAIKEAALTRHTWFLPGSTPSTIVDRVNSLGQLKPPKGCSLGEYLEGDFSRYDGRQTETVRRIVFDIMRACIDNRHVASWDSMIDAHFKTVCRTSSGVPYEFFGSMLSGAWCTTDANTILNAFVVFCGLKELNLSDSAAWNLIGLCFGDDSLYREVVNEEGTALSDVVVKVAADLGLKLELEKRGYGWVTLLSRYYRLSNNLEVVASCPDLARLLPKFHILTKRNAPEEQYKAKFSSLLLLCGNTTPVLSTYLRKWFSFSGTRSLDLDEVINSGVEIPYWMRYLDGTESFSFPACDDELSYVVKANAASAWNTSVDSLDRLESCVLDSTSLVDLKKIYLDNGPPGTTSSKFNIRSEIENKAVPRPLSKPGKKTPAPKETGKPGVNPGPSKARPAAPPPYSEDPESPGTNPGPPEAQPGAPPAYSHPVGQLQPAGVIRNSSNSKRKEKTNRDEKKVPGRKANARTAGPKRNPAKTRC